jgi:hypothetical protein
VSNGATKIPQYSTKLVGFIGVFVFLMSYKYFAIIGWGLAGGLFIFENNINFYKTKTRQYDKNII